VSGHTAAAPPSRAMNSRRFMDFPRVPRSTLAHRGSRVVFCAAAKQPPAVGFAPRR
jgi:hypothetical protein